MKDLRDLSQLTFSSGGSKGGGGLMNNHVARTPPVRASVRHTCCQGQASDLLVRPDRARCINLAINTCHFVEKTSIRYLALS